MADATSDRFHRVDALFGAALEVATPERSAFLDSACAGDAGLRAEVEELLSAHDASSDFLSDPAAEFAAPFFAAAQPNAEAPPFVGSIGPFRIVREIGHGGMGTVYLAERSDGQLEQRVALKLIRHAASRALVQRFLDERRILAMLQHPRIAHLVDGGVAPDGSPWFAMEYVEGEPIDRYCDAKSASIGERLALFDAVCDAVQYAHSQLIVHRDLKPSNILVTADGQIKLLDFGIAKMLDPLVIGDDEPAQTNTRLRAMTPEYAAPEQVLGRPVSTATDVYALGVLLYVLLAGQRPYEVRDRSASEIERIVCETDPPRPSTTLFGSSTAAEQREERARSRATTPDRLRRALQGDLDVIVMSAIRKEPSRRYASAAAFRDDIQRFRDQRPVLARGDSATYRLRKFVRRRAPVLAAGAAALILLAAAGVRERVLRGRAEAGTRKAEQTTDFMIGLFQASENGQSFHDTLTAAALLDRGITRANGMSAQPELQAQMFDVIGQLEAAIGQLDKARPLLERALDMRRRLYGEDHADVATSLGNLAGVVFLSGDLASALKLRSEELALRRRLFGNSDVKTTDALFRLATDLHAVGRSGAGDSLFNEWIGTVASAPAEVTPTRAVQLHGLANIYEYRQHYAEAEHWLREEMAMNRQLYGERSDRVGVSMADLAELFNREGRHGEADTLMKHAIDLLRSAYPNGHPILATYLAVWAALLEDVSRYREAESLLREGLAMTERFGGDNANETITTKLQLAYTLTALGKYNEAASLATQGLAALRAKYNDHAPFVNRARYLLGDALRGQHKYAEAEALLLSSYADLSKGSGRGLGKSWADSARAALARLYDAEGKPDEAQKYRALQR
jgi:serine/threonine-protein kinase